MDGLLLVIDMLGNTISALKAQLAAAEAEIAELRARSATQP